MGDEEAVRRINSIEEYVANHPTTVVIEHPKYIEVIVSR